MSKDDSSTGLIRSLDWVNSVAVIVGSMIGAGVFAITGTAAGIMGPAVPIGFLAGVPVIVTTALIYSVFMSGPLGKEPGGAYIHISRTWNSLYLGYIFMWLKWIGFVAGNASLAIAFGQAMRSFQVLNFLSVTGWAVVGATTFFVLHLIGVNLFGDSQTFMTGILVAILLLLVVPGIFFINIQNFDPFFPSSLYDNGFISPVLGGISTLFFAYLGFENLAQTAGETKNPEKTFPKIFSYSATVVGIFYVIIAIVVIGVLGWQTAANSSVALTQTAEVYFPAGTAAIIALGSILGYSTTINAGYQSLSRILYSFSKDRIIPPIFGRTDDRFNTPYVALTISWVLILFLVVNSSFLFAISITLSALVILYAMHSLSALVLPWVRPELYRKCSVQFTPFRLSLIAIISASAMIIFGWQNLSLGTLGPALTMAIQGRIVDSLTESPAFLLLIWAIIGSVLYFSYRIYIMSTDENVDYDAIIADLYK